VAAASGSANDANERATEAIARPYDGLVAVAGVQPWTVSHELAWERTPYYGGNLYLAFMFIFIILHL
jgi:hypothetical protein